MPSITITRRRICKRTSKGVLSLGQSTLFSVSVEVAARSSAPYTRLKAGAPFHSLCYSAAGPQPEAKPLVCARTALSSSLSLPSRRGYAGLAPRSEKRPEQRLYQEVVALLIQTFQTQRWLTGVFISPSCFRNTSSRPCRPLESPRCVYLAAPLELFFPAPRR